MTTRQQSSRRIARLMILTAALTLIALLGEPVVRWWPVYASFPDQALPPGSEPLSYHRLWVDRRDRRDCARLRDLRLYGASRDSTTILNHYATLFSLDGWQVSTGRASLWAGNPDGVVVTIQTFERAADLLGDAAPDRAEGYRSFYFVSLYSDWIGPCLIPR